MRIVDKEGCSYMYHILTPNIIRIGSKNGDRGTKPGKSIMY